ncbi:MAG: serine/threonine protein kinase [Elusimicrobia bacterium]|nr:serine/threonine protein kinase [Elusimicrobiota bacterium]
MGREKIFQESNDFRRVVKSALADDEGRYQGALAQFSQRRRDTMILAAFVASLILIVSAFLYVFWRKSSALDKLITTYSTQPPQTGPARIPSMGAAGGLMLGTVLANNYRIDPASALDYAHSRKVIHRDLKPANIMITREGVVKLMDFGIAHQARLTAAKLTRAESWGTPPYMAPEQELGAVSKESDIYSLGVCLYETLTGKVPFEGPNFLAQKRERLYLRPSNVGFSTNVDIFFDKAFQPEPAKRFHSGAEMLAAFKAV